MAGFLAPPSPPARIQWEGQPSILVPKTGLTIVPGQGLTARTDTAGSRLLLDNSRADAVEVFSLYQPGAVAAGKLGVWGNTRTSRRAVVRTLEANLSTPPSVLDTVNYHAVTLTGQDGGQLVLPLSNLSGHYLLDRGDGVEIATGAGFAIGNANLRSGSRWCLQHGRAYPFTPTSDLTVTGVMAQFTPMRSTDFVTYYDGWATPTPVRGAILDAAGTVLGAGYSLQGGIPNTNRQPNVDVRPTAYSFPVSIRLLQGVTYYMAVDCFENIPKDSLAYLAPVSGSGAAGVPLTGNPGGLQGLNVALPYGNNGAPVTGSDGYTWADAVAGRPPKIGVLEGVIETDAQLGAGTLFGTCAWGLLGSGGAFISSGDLTVSVSAVGVPPAGAAGLNVRAVLLGGT